MFSSVVMLLFLPKVTNNGSIHFSEKVILKCRLCYIVMFVDADCLDHCLFFNSGIAGVNTFSTSQYSRSIQDDRF
jgi:hypothetical protein